MTETRNISDDTQMLPQTPTHVKALLVASGVPMGQLAKAVGIANSTLTDYAQGKLRNPERQLAIYRAWCRLTGRRWTWGGLAEFWGGLLSEDKDNNTTRAARAEARRTA